MKTADNYKTIFRFLKSERRNVRSIFIFSLCGNLLLLSIPFVIQQLMDQYSILVFQQSTLFLILLAVLFLAGICCMRALQMHFSERLQRRLFFDAVAKIKRNILEFQSTNSPVDFHKINYVFESINLQKSLAPLIIDGATLGLQSALVFVLISFYHPLFFIYSALILGSLYYALVVKGKRIEQLSFLESKKKYAVVSSLQKLSLKRVEETSEESRVVDNSLLDYFRTRDDRYNNYFNQSLSILLIKMIASIVLVTIGGLLVVNNAMTIGQLVASEMIIANLLISLFKFTHLLDYWYDSIVGLDKLETQFTSGEGV